MGGYYFVELIQFSFSYSFFKEGESRGHLLTSHFNHSHTISGEVTSNKQIL